MAISTGTSRPLLAQIGMTTQTEDSRNQPKANAYNEPGPAVTALDGAQCQVVQRKEHPGGDIGSLKVSSRESCCQACGQDSRCVTAAFCGGDTCFMKDRTASAATDNDVCDAIIAHPELVNNPWLPNDPDVEKIIEAMPDNQKNKHKHGAWELLKQRIRYNAAMWSKMNVTFPSLPAKPVRILMLYSPTVLYGMDWHTGEHLQWGDLIYALARLGHKVYIPAKYNWKRWREHHAEWDMIVTDYGGVSELWRAKAKLEKTGGSVEQKATLEANIQALRCKLRVVDTFGTSEEFNNINRPKMSKKMPPALGIRLDQYWSYYPQVGPRSTFIGFTVTNHDFGFAAAATKPAPERRWKALLWGKHPPYMGLERNKGWLQAISKHIDIVATIDSEALESGEFADTLPDFIENRGILQASEYFDLLRSSALLIGVGQPFWGNAPLDALQQGVMTLMPSFHPSVGRCQQCVHLLPGIGDDSDEGKAVKGRFDNMPNRIAFSSQNPYVERLGEPDVYMLPLDAHTGNLTIVQQVLARARAYFEGRVAAGQVFPSRLPEIWKPQAFVNRLSEVMQRNSLCGGTRNAAFLAFTYAYVF